MINISIIFVLMMLPGLAVLATSFIVSLFETSPSDISRKLAERIHKKHTGFWKVEG